LPAEARPEDERQPAPDATPETERQLQRALEVAYRQLNRRDRTEAEMRSHLERREVQPAAIELAIGELLENGYLDDARYARLFVQDKRALEGWGFERIRRELFQRGIDRELIASALAGDETESELERALALLRQRFPGPCSDRRERDRALGMMLRKGYDSEVALDALAAHARSD
jgi:regulatory protein